MCSPSSLLAAAILVLAAGTATAQTIALHSGAADPTAEGWTRVNFVPTTTLGPTNEGDIPAWRIGSGGGSFGGRYEGSVSANDQSASVTQGWTLSASFRIQPGAVYEDYNTGISYSGPAPRRHTMRIGHRPNGDLFVKLITGNLTQPPIGPEYTLEGGQGAYHRFDLVCQPQGTADLFVDGTERISDYAGEITANPPGVVYFTMGSGQSDAAMFFHHVELRLGTDRPLPASPGTWGRIKSIYRGGPD